MKVSRFDLKDQQMTVQASTVLKVLGRSSLFILDILIRESVQNSLDAVSENCKDYIKFNFDIVKSKNYAELIGKLSFLEQSKSSDPLFNRLARRISQNDPVMLVLSDSGTTGLSGPVKRTDANWNSYKGRRNFENLIYQLGLNHGTSGAGGSYGFGKSIYYHLSAAGLVMFYSKSKEGERLIFSMISIEENKTSTQSTGIAWWGDVYKNKGIEYSAPIENPAQINEILTKMGLEDKRFKSKETGTLICVVAPKLKNLLNTEAELQENQTEEESDSVDSQIEKIKEMVKDSVLRWYWPRMTETNEIKPTGKLKQLKFYNFKREIELAEPYNAMGKLLIAAENLNNGVKGKHPHDIKTEKINHSYGQTFLGTLAYSMFDMNLSMDHFNKILMIRAPRMVVFEMPVQERPNKSVVALFLVNSKEKVWPNSNRDTEKQPLDDAFRDCESATHSEWNYQDLKADQSWFKSYVKTAKEKVLKIIQTSMNPVSLTMSENQFSGAAKLLGKLLLTEESGGVETFKSSRTRVTGSSPGARIAKTNLEITKTEFIGNNNIQLTISIGNTDPGNFEISLLAKGGRESLDSVSWKKQLGKEFPFKIIKGDSDDINDVKILQDTFIRFSLKGVKSRSITLYLSIQLIRRDALISFKINKI